MKTGKGRHAATKAETATPEEGPAASAANPASVEPPALETIMGYLVRRSHYVFHTYWMAHFRAAENPITPMQAGVMLMLRRHPFATQSELGRIMGIEAPTAYNLIVKLTQYGYIERILSESDRRAQMLRLTPSGIAILTAIGEAIAARDAELMADFTEAERTLLAKLLVRIILNGNEYLGISQQVVNAASGQTVRTSEKPEAPPRRPRPARPSSRWHVRQRLRD